MRMAFATFKFDGMLRPWHSLAVLAELNGDDSFDNGS